MKEREQKRSHVVVGNTGLQQEPCSGPQGAVEWEDPNTVRDREGKGYKDSDRTEWPLCMHQKVTMAGAGRELAGQEEAALFWDLKAGQK